LDCNVLIPAAESKDWTAPEATAIYDAGQIASYGSIGGQEDAFHLNVPEPDISLLALGGLALRRRRRASN